MLSVKCACAERPCPKTQRLCDGVVELTRARRCDPDASPGLPPPPPPPPPRRELLRLTDLYGLDLDDGASISECDVCLCPVDAEARTELLTQFEEVVRSSREALAEIEATRKEEGRISRGDEEERKKHFLQVLTACQTLLRVSSFDSFTWLRNEITARENRFPSYLA